MTSRCNIHDCTEPRCAESEFWCKKHYIQFRTAGMAQVNATPPGTEAHGGRKRQVADEAPETPVNTPDGFGDVISRQIRPFRRDM